MHASTAKTIVIKDSSTNAVVETIMVDGAQVSIVGGTVTINVTDASLVVGNGYYVEVEAGAFVDTAGNESAAIGSNVWNVSVNEMSTVIEVSGNNRVNAAENDTDVSVTVTVSASVQILQDLVVGDFTVSAVQDSNNTQVTLSNANYNSANGTWTATITSGTLMDNETYTITANVAGTEGNARGLSAPAVTQAVSVDTTAPTLGSVAVATENVVNISEVAQGFNISGTAIGLEAGDELNVELNNETYTAITEADGSWSVTVNSLDAANLNDGGTYTVSVNAIDAHGNAATQVSQTITVDRSAPINTIFVDQAITAVPTITGQTSESSVEVRVDTDNDGNYDNGTYTVSVSDGRWSLDLAQVNAQGQSSPLSYEDISTSVLGLQVTATDEAGNSTVQTQSLAKEETSFSISDSRVIEGETGTKTMTFIVTREGDLSSEGSVQYAIDTDLSLAKSGGDADGVDDDYAGATSGTVSFAEGESFKEITLTVNGDYFKEVNQKVVMELSDSNGGVISKAIAVGEITEVDTSAMSGAFSLKDINSDLVSNAIRVRRSFDDAEMDIGFDQYGNLDTQTLLEFVNNNDSGAAVQGAVGYVTTWYDQSDRQAHLTQTSDSKQGVIVDDGALVTHSNGDATISFNQGLNGTESDDYMSMASASASSTSATNVEVYVTLEYNSTGGTLFNIGQGTTNTNRISAHAPHSSDRTYWDAGSAIDSRLSAPAVQVSNQAQQLVFTANYNYTSAGTDALNHVDAKQGLFVDGEVKAFGDSLVGNNLTLGSTWYLSTGSASATGQATMISEFMVYTNNSSTPATTPTEMIGSAVNNTFTYAGESGLTHIDGQTGYDTVHLSSGGVNLDATNVTLESIELIHMQNGETNQFVINDTQLNSNGAMMNVLMDAGDSVLYGATALGYNAASSELIKFGTEGNDTINMSVFNETAYGRGGDDVFVYHSWSDARADGVVSKDTIADFTLGADSGDHLDLSDLLSYAETDTLSNFIQVMGGEVEGGDVTINIDKDGSNDFSSPDQVIVLTGTGSSTIPVTLDFLDDHNLIVL